MITTKITAKKNFRSVCYNNSHLLSKFYFFTVYATCRSKLIQLIYML